jgi:hypothetical protein
VVVHFYNPNYLGGRDWQFRSSAGNKASEIPLNNKLGVGVHACNPSCAGDIGRRMAVKNNCRQKKRLLLKNN